MTKKPGRPSFKATPSRRRTVEEMVACGESHDTIARAVGCSDETLRTHFADELATGHAKRRSEVIGLLYKTARGGNVSAQRKLAEMTGRGPALSEPLKQPPPGKKDEARAAATAAASNGRYATPPAPKLAVDNTRG
ncbi:MAG TPA: hypothetical protein VGR45_11005 [Stellaceae bacterium]|nr:hypothetical protein [Stellaceae bacterium]